jgi:hypothetical protein
VFTNFYFQCSLYRGKVGLDVAEAQHLMDGLDWQGAVKDIEASVNWLKSNGSKKVYSDFDLSCYYEVKVNIYLYGIQMLD